MSHEKLNGDFELFRNHCIEIRHQYNVYVNLFNEDSEPVLSKVAATFFTEIASIMHRDWKLQVCKIMDAAEMYGKVNITIDLINKQLADEGLMDSEVNSLSLALKAFGAKVKPARNKRIAHYDRLSQINGSDLGGTTESELEGFLNNLQEYCDKVGRLVGIGPLDFSGGGCAGDELDLLKCLRAYCKNA
ncbi:hypothetical protein ACN06F_04555 [Vreelandella sp. 21]|uniref:AbiU2 domain-containing protein n=1 Tax=Vreelandella sp. 21 TaxID=3402864 RepID=UPI003D9A54AD